MSATMVIRNAIIYDGSGDAPFPADVQTMLRHRSTMIGSDGIPTLEGRPHPRLYNTRYSADTFGLAGRGRIEAGFHADLVVFDPATVIDRGTFDDPNHYPDGIHRVFVNGVEVVRDDTYTGARPGRALPRVD